MAVSISESNWIVLDASLRVGVQRTLRIPDDGSTYPLPPAFGRISIAPADAWGEGHFLVPMYPQEAAWLQFSARQQDPRGVKVGAGAIDALTGEPWSDRLSASPQNYVVVPDQPWLDGFKVAAGVVRQFIAVPLGQDETVEHRVRGMERGGIQIASFPPKPGALTPERLRGEPPPAKARTHELGLGTGGRIEQRVYPDRFGIETWAETPPVTIVLHLIDATEYARESGQPAPPTSIDAATYMRYGLPWFEVYDSARGELPATPKLAAMEPANAAAAATDADADAARPREPAKRPDNVRPIPPRSGRKRP